MFVHFDESPLFVLLIYYFVTKKSIRATMAQSSIGKTYLLFK